MSTVLQSAFAEQSLRHLSRVQANVLFLIKRQRRVSMMLVIVLSLYLQDRYAVNAWTT
jgi:hypothetical protein